MVTPAGLDLPVGRSVKAIGIADGTRFLEGTVTAYAGTNLELSVSATGGTGRHGAWVMASLGGFAMQGAGLGRVLEGNSGPGRDAVAGDPVRLELRTVDAARPANP